MAKDNAGIEVNNGDTIEVSAQGVVISGEVISADWYAESGWYIEMVKANVAGGYSYWKQRDDGGTIRSINGQIILVKQ